MGLSWRREEQRGRPIRVSTAAAIFVCLLPSNQLLREREIYARTICVSTDGIYTLGPLTPHMEEGRGNSGRRPLTFFLSLYKEGRMLVYERDKRYTVAITRKETCYV